ncbi:MAG TPA: rhodanese-like domain-containing protein, partial [Methanobacteriaceae archaeon]|nr:rhodanese-like domain-containing protein [Methanobacteriaceae archaeon]
VYCKTGRRGGMAMKAMEEAGFNEVYNLIGGYEIWEKE